MQKNQTKVIRCSCEHAAQDKLFGRGMRVHNSMNNGWRCTVCRREVMTGGAR